MTYASRTCLVAASLFAINLLSSQVAVAVTETDITGSNGVPRTLPSETKSEKLEAQRADLAVADKLAPSLVQSPVDQAAAKDQSKTFVSDGRPFALETLGVTITPPAGWEIQTMTGSLSTVMREPRIETPSYDKPKYQRNITIATVHQASPIDEKRAQELRAEMMKTFGADPVVSDFQIIEHKFFNYRGQNDGLLVYSSLKIGEYPMMQMHVLVSGQAKQFLLSYTDLAERFSDQKDGNFEKAWNSIVSVEVTGTSPNRYDAYMRYGAAAGGFVLFCFALLMIRRRATRFDYGSVADSMIDESNDLAVTDSPSASVFSTLAGGWKLRGNTAHGTSKDFSDFDFVTEAPRTRQTEYVSNY